MEIIIGLLIGMFGRWFYFRIKEWQIMKPYDGSSLWQVIKDNLGLPGGRGQ